jgi:hypothetical protein
MDLARPVIPSARARLWFGTGEAAQLLGMSPTTLRDRSKTAPHWVKGKHFRCIIVGTRAKMQFHVDNITRLLDTHGW